MEDLCFDAMYVYSLLTRGLGINSSTWSNVYFNDEVSDADCTYKTLFNTLQMVGTYTKSLVGERTREPCI